VFALAGLAVLLGLGTWQVERKVWKEGLIATLNQRLSADPTPLPAASEWRDLKLADRDFTRVRFRGEFLPGRRIDDPQREARLYTGASALRDDVKAPGYIVFAPARLPDGHTVVVNRGYVANPRPTAATPPVALPPGPVDVIGVIRFPDRPGWFDQLHSAADDLWFVRDPAAMAARHGWGTVAPFYIEMEGPVPPDNVPKPGRLKVSLPNNHLGYALTWFGLAAALAAVFAFWVRSRRREGSGMRLENP
jgi:surfeit locus 1 family protein